MLNKTGLPIFYRIKGASENTAGELDDDVEPILAETKGDPREQDYREELAYRPRMYSYAHPAKMFFGNKTCIKVAESLWSTPVGLDKVGTEGSLIVRQPESLGRTQYELGITIDLLPGRFFRTKQISFVPRYILISQLTQNVFFRQSETGTGYLLEPFSQLPFHWPDGTLPLELCVSLGDSHLWSSSFQITQIAEFIVKVPYNENQASLKKRSQIGRAHV